MALEDQFASRFKCAKCRSTGARVKRIAAPGRGISKILDIQHNQFIMVSCGHCGYTEVYNPEVIEGKRHVGSILDILFGG
jgi:predicted nucleic-acid-binding Zn-ribbon protein